MSTSREHILAAIRGINRKTKNLPEIPEFGLSGAIEQHFINSILGNKGEVLSVEEFESWVQVSGFQKIISVADRFRDISTVDLPSDPHELENLTLAIINGQFGVAENGAIWLEDSNLRLRALPFITEHLAIILDKKNLVPTMHQAYDLIGSNHSGFGLFIAGPSKTADIEQSLVIGAHGAKSLRVIFI